MKEKNFKFKKSYAKVIKDMTDKQAGEFIKGICGYAFEDKPFVTKDGYLKGLYLYIKQDLDVSAMNAANGKKGAEKLAENKRMGNVAKGFGILIGDMRFSAGKPKNGKKDEQNPLR